MRDTHATGKAVVAPIERSVLITGAAGVVGANLAHRLEVSPASVSALAPDEEGARVLTVNDTGALGANGG